MKKTLLIVMAMMVLIAAAGCRANDRKEEKPTTTPSAEVLPDNSMNDGDIMDGENTGEIPENGVDSGKDNTAQNDQSDAAGNAGDDIQNENVQNGASSGNSANDGSDANTTAAPELVPSAEATQPNTSEDVKK